MRIKRRSGAIGGGLSPLEIKIMNAAWSKGKLTVRGIHEPLLADGYIPYTSVMAIMNGLVAKGLLKQDKSSRTYVYKPNVERKELAVRIVDEVIDGILQGDAKPIAEHLDNRSVRASSKQKPKRR